MHPTLQALIDRREVTQPPKTEHGETSVTVDTGNIEHKLDKLIRAVEATFVQLAVTDREPPQSRVDNFPAAGMCRFILRRTGDGGTYAVAQNTPLLIAEAKEFRVGGEIVNAGANPATLFFTEDLITPGTSTPLSGATPQVFLPTNAVWKFSDFGVIWCGNVIAVCTVTGGTTLTVADI